MDITSAETKATYDELKKYVAEHNAGMKVSNKKCRIYAACGVSQTPKIVNKERCICYARYTRG